MREQRFPEVKYFAQCHSEVMGPDLEPRHFRSHSQALQQYLALPYCQGELLKQLAK